MVFLDVLSELLVLEMVTKFILSLDFVIIEIRSVDQFAECLMRYKMFSQSTAVVVNLLCRKTKAKELCLSTRKATNAQIRSRAVPP